MRRKDILALAGEMAALHGRDPFSAARAQGVRVAFYPFRDLPGMYGTVLGIPVIAIQSGLSPMAARVICAHEMGHHFLHRPVANVGFFGESLVVGGAGKLEREANLFAAEFLLSDGEVYEPLTVGISAEAIAQELSVPPELVAVKILSLTEKGIAVEGDEPPARFLKNGVRMPENGNWSADSL